MVTSHLYAPVGRESAIESYHADRLLGWCATDLGLAPAPVLKWTEYHGVGERLRDERGRKLEPRPRYVVGWWAPGDDSINVCHDLPLRQLLTTLGHECWHAAEARVGLPADESAAERYGKAVSDAYWRRQIP